MLRFLCSYLKYFIRDFFGDNREYFIRDFFGDNRELTTFQVNASSGKHMQISVYRSQNGVERGMGHPFGRHFVSNIQLSAWVCHQRR